MTNDCQEIEIREVLPELVHGMLPEGWREQVRQHVESCDDCAAELAIIRAVLDSAATPQVNVARIAAAIPAYRRKSFGSRRVLMELAAACLIGAVGISAFAIHNSGSGVAGQHSAVSATVTGEPGLALVNTSDLSDAGLAQLTSELDNLQAMPTTDPESVTPVVLEEVAGPVVVGDSA